MARTLAAAGAHRSDIVHNAYGYGLFTGGLGLHYGAERLGAAVIPISGGQTRRQIMLIQDFGPTAICCTPSFALYLAEVGQEMGVDLPGPKLRVGIFGAEPWSEGMRQEIENRLSIDALDIYGLSEIIGPGVGVECLEAKSGPAHLRGPLPRRRSSTPRRWKRLPPGETGELVITTLTKEAFPLIRYRTRDVTSLIRPLQMRPHPRPHGARQGPQRRHAHHPRGQRLPLPDRVGADGDPGGGAPLPAHRGPGRASRHPGGPGGGG